MTKEECYRLGNITKPFGYKGQMVMYLDVDSPEEYADLDSAFVEVKGHLVPYFFKFKVVDAQHGEIGKIASIIEYPAQPLFQIMQDGTEILIPVIDQVIKKVYREEKTIFIEAPNGLIDLYLGS